MKGTFRDLSTAIQYSRDSVDHAQGASILNDAIAAAADLMEKTARRKEIAEIMAQEASVQTYAMAALTVSGALAFHDLAAAESESRGRRISLLADIVFGGEFVDVAMLLEAWKDILEINYFPIFDPAKKILSKLTAHDAAEIASRLYKTNSRIISMGLGNSPDLYGQVFQKSISDRKKLAAFYTKPAAATLLAAVTIPDRWRDEESVRSLRVADFACGTGALLLAAYRRLAANYEAASGESMRDLHPHMMAECLIGADVLPIATHLTAAGLTNVYPKQQYEHTRIYQPVQGGKDCKIGSLEWIKQDATLDYTERRLTGTGTRGERETPAHGSCDIVLMNPPYVRSTGPGGRTDQSDTRQMFTAFGATNEDRRKISERATKMFANLPSAKGQKYCADKRAGLATFFMDLAHAKLRGGGGGECWGWFCQ